MIRERDNEIVDNNNCELEYPLEIRPVDPIIEKEMLKDFTGLCECEWILHFMLLLVAELNESYIYYLVCLTVAAGFITVSFVFRRVRIAEEKFEIS